MPVLQIHHSMDFMVVYPYQKGKMKGNYMIRFLESKIQKWVFCLMASINLLTQQFLLISSVCHIKYQRYKNMRNNELEIFCSWV